MSLHGFQVKITSRMRSSVLDLNMSRSYVRKHRKQAATVKKSFHRFLEMWLYHEWHMRTHPNVTWSKYMGRLRTDCNNGLLEELEPYLHTVDLL